jgi:hypothetical protein
MLKSVTCSDGSGVANLGVRETMLRSSDIGVRFRCCGSGEMTWSQL